MLGEITEAPAVAATAGERVEVYRPGPYPHDGLRVNVYGATGDIRHWCLVRASGTEAVLRAYMEIVEPLDRPDPTRLVRQWTPLLRYLGLDRYRIKAGAPDYVEAFANTLRVKYGS